MGRECGVTLRDRETGSPSEEERQEERKREEKKNQVPVFFSFFLIQIKSHTRGALP